LDDHRFDRLVRTLSTTPTRRRVLTGGVGCTLATLGAALGFPQLAAADCRRRKERCSESNQCCGASKGKTRCRQLSEAGDCPSGRRCCGVRGTKCTNDCGCCENLACNPGTNRCA
jgi:hypothetical protein